MLGFSLWLELWTPELSFRTSGKVQLFYSDWDSFWISLSGATDWEMKRWGSLSPLNGGDPEWISFAQEGGQRWTACLHKYPQGFGFLPTCAPMVTRWWTTKKMRTILMWYFHARNSKFTKNYTSLIFESRPTKIYNKYMKKRRNNYMHASSSSIQVAPAILWIAKTWNLLTFILMVEVVVICNLFSGEYVPLREKYHLWIGKTQ